MGRGVPVEFGPRALLALPRGAALAYRDSVGASGNPPLMLLHGLGITADRVFALTGIRYRRQIQPCSALTARGYLRHRLPERHR
jgi:hypothetical protein